MNTFAIIYALSLPVLAVVIFRLVTSKKKRDLLNTEFRLGRTPDDDANRS